MKKKTLAWAFACLAALPVAHAATSAPPMEAWVAPPSIFPPDGAFTKAGAKAYQPYQVHASPDGPALGHVETSYLKCGADCEDPQATLVTLDGKRYRLTTDNWSGMSMGLVSYDASVISGNAAWSKIRHAKGEFWIKTPKKDVHPYEELVNFADHFDTVCTKPGACQPVTAAMRKNMASLPFKGCVGYPYEVKNW